LFCPNGIKGKTKGEAGVYLELVNPKWLGINCNVYSIKTVSGLDGDYKSTSLSNCFYSKNKRSRAAWGFHHFCPTPTVNTGILEFEVTLDIAGPLKELTLEAVDENDG